MIPARYFTIFAALCIAGGFAIEWRNLRVSYGQFLEIPFTLEELKQSKNYSLMVRDHELKLNFFAFKNDPRVAIGFDSYGNIGGLRVSFIKEDLPAKATANNASFPDFFSNKPLYTSGTFLSTEVWYIDVLFTHPDVLRAGGRKETGGLLGEEAYVKLNGKWTAWPQNECDAPSQGFDLQSCYPIMGLHYFYGMNPETVCNDIQPVFGLFENGEMIGLGVAALGVQTAAPERTWLEVAPTELFLDFTIKLSRAFSIYWEFSNKAFCDYDGFQWFWFCCKAIISNRPDCFEPWLQDYGITSLHFFFKADYASTPCPESVCQN